MAKLIMTVAEMQDREKWLELRKTGICGSEIAAVVGMNPFKSAFQLWLEKTSQVEPEDLSNNEYIYWGNVLEQAVADRFCELTGKKVTKRGVLQDCKYPFMLASVDRMIVGENAGLECKTANAFAHKGWKDDEIPDSYYIQCQWYMSVTGCEKWYIAVLIGGNRFIWKEISRNEDDIAALREAAIGFRYKVENNIMPDVDGSENCSEALAKKLSVQADAVELPGEAQQELEKIAELGETIGVLLKQQEQEKNKLKKRLVEYKAEVGIVGDRKVSWKEQAGRITVDKDRLQAELPDVYEKYKKVGKPSRSFRIA